MTDIIISKKLTGLPPCPSAFPLRNQAVLLPLLAQLPPRSVQTLLATTGGASDFRPSNGSLKMHWMDKRDKITKQTTSPKSRML
jgi:hypothetical protein